jgi:hypothetical protein
MRDQPEQRCSLPLMSLVAERRTLDPNNYHASGENGEAFVFF